jgi:hypothetical protein
MLLSVTNTLKFLTAFHFSQVTIEFSVISIPVLKLFDFVFIIILKWKVVVTVDRKVVVVKS